MSEPVDPPAPFSGLRVVPPEVQACFPKSDPNRFPGELLPPFLLSRMFLECTTSGTGLCELAAATLQAAAIAMGGSMRLEIKGGRTIGPAFNLCYAVPASTRDAGAIEPVIAPLRHRIQAFQDSARQQEAATLAWKIREKNAEIEASGGTVSPNPELVRRMTLECMRLTASSAPEMLLSRFSVAAVERALPTSVDRALIYIAEGVDPTDAWEALPRVDREELARQLNLSWDGALSTGAAPEPADLNVLWVTAVSNLPSLYANRELFACGRPVPLLLLTEAPASPSTPSAEATSHWDEIVGKLLDLRMAKERILYKLSAEAGDEFSRFVASFRQRVGGLPAEHQKHLGYLPDLVRRIALICEILQIEDLKEIGRESLEAGMQLGEWFGMAHATALSEIPPIDRRRARPDCTARPDKKPAGEVMLAKITLKAPVTRRKLWDSYNKPTRESFQPVLDALLLTGKVRWLGPKHLVPANWGALGASAGIPPATPVTASLSSGASSC